MGIHIRDRHRKHQRSSKEILKSEPASTSLMTQSTQHDQPKSNREGQKRYLPTALSMFNLKQLTMKSCPSSPKPDPEPCAKPTASKVTCNPNWIPISTPNSLPRIVLGMSPKSTFKMNPKRTPKRSPKSTSEFAEKHSQKLTVIEEERVLLYSSVNNVPISSINVPNRLQEKSVITSKKKTKKKRKKRKKKQNVQTSRVFQFQSLFPQSFSDQRKLYLSLDLTLNHHRKPRI